MRPGAGKARAPGASPHRGDFLLPQSARRPGGGRVTGRGARGRGVGRRGARGPAGTLTRRRRGEAACSPSAECPSPWPRRLRGPPPPGAANARWLEGCARRPARLAPLPSGGYRRRLHARAPRRPAPSAAWPPAPHRPLRRQPNTSRSPARGRHVAGAGPCRHAAARARGRTRRGCGPGSRAPIGRRRTWAGRLGGVGGSLLPAKGWAGPAWVNAPGVRTGRGCQFPAPSGETRLAKSWGDPGPALASRFLVYFKFSLVSVI